VLRVENLRAVHAGRHRTVVAAHDVSFDVAAGECVALVGESGSGKTTIARCVAGLHPPAEGTILLNGRELAGTARRRLRDERRRLQIELHNPYESLKPRHRVGDAIARPMRVLGGRSGRGVDEAVARLLERVRLPPRIATRFPHELSGGERQRVALARALAPEPEVIVCDEVTSALDVSVQAVVLELLAELRRELGMAVLFISHDLGVVATIADRVLVLEGGLICDDGPVGDVVTKPRHPYTRRLLDAAPRPFA
jgi:peptide/nickel transport system ATP-binding protein